MYPIEIVVANPDLYVSVQRAIDSLNMLQREFYYYRPSPELETDATVLKELGHHSDNLFKWLESYRQESGGYRPYQILIVDGKLATPRFTNAFGNHRADQGFALFTVHDRGRFVADLVRFVRYYLVRYTLSFANPKLRSHQDTRGCFFDRKEYKPDIQASLQSGGLCEEHKRELFETLTSPVRNAVEILGKRVAEDLPYALVMKGGGVKGLAFAGAFEVLALRLSFDVFAGTSAGSIAAVLLAAGYNAQELRNEMYALNFRSFRDGGILRTPHNLIRHRALYSGNRIEEWVNECLATRYSVPLPVRLRDLKNRAVVYAASRNGLQIFDSNGERRDTSAGFAVLCSSAVPGLFASPLVEGVKFFDGGLGQNFPLAHFIEGNRDKPVIGLYLLPPQKKSRFVLSQLIDAVTTGEEPEAVRKYGSQIVSIDPAPIRTADFAISELGKNFLLATGRAAAMRFLAANLPDEAPSSSELEQAEKEEAELRAKVSQETGRK